jgi:hypothetical protein
LGRVDGAEKSLSAVRVSLRGTNGYSGRDGITLTPEREYLPEYPFVPRSDTRTADRLFSAPSTLPKVVRAL